MSTWGMLCAQSKGQGLEARETFSGLHFGSLILLYQYIIYMIYDI